MTDNSATLEGLTVLRRDSNGKLFSTLSVPHLSIPSGACIGIAGPSGAGKSTLLDVLAGLLVPTTGSVTWGNTPLSNFTDRERAIWRRHNVGQVFQDFLLIPELSILANVVLPISFARLRATTDQRQRALDVIASLGLKDAGRHAAVLSRGEQQRVALARALVMNPSIILADEPTASLDQVSAGLVTDLLFDEARQRHATLIIASHESAILSRMDLVYRIVGGEVQEAT